MAPKKKSPATAKRGALKKVAAALEAPADVSRETSTTVSRAQAAPTDSPTDSVPTDNDEHEPSQEEVERHLEVERICGGKVLMMDVRPEECRPITSVSRHPENPNEGDLGVIHESLEKGLYRRIVVQKCTPEGRRRMLILAGNHTHQAAEEAGYAALPMEFIVCSDRVATKILVGDNRTNRLGSENKQALAKILTELAASDDLAGTGYTGDDVDELLYELNHADDEDGSQGSSGDLLGVTEVSVADPTHECEVGDVWQLGPHRLFVCDVFLGWPEWKKALRSEDKDLFCPFPGPFVATSSAGEKNRLILVQPDPYVAGHILDRYVEVHGEKGVKKLEDAALGAEAA